MARITSVTLPDSSVYYLDWLDYSTDTTNEPNVWRSYFANSSTPVIAADLTTNMSISSGLDQNVKKSGVLTIYANGFAMPNPGTNNDQGWIRMLGTGESNSVLEIATGDDADGKIVCRQYFANGNYREACILDSSGNSEFYGNITTYGNYESKNASITINTSSNNGVASDQFYYHAAKDSANYRYGLLQFAARTTGNIDVCLRANNKKTDGTEVQNELWLYANKDGTKTYKVSDQANFRKAIGLEEDSWTNVNSSKQSYRKYHNVVYIRDHNSSTALTTSYTTLFTLPTGYRPARETYFAVNGKSNGTVACIKITTGGVVSAMTMVGTASLYGFQISFLLG